jgi:hypothetical protein
MKTIRFRDEAEHEEGLRLIVLSGPVEYSEKFAVYRVPDDIVTLLDEKGISFEMIQPAQNSGKATL